jgi:hypothetical protein
MVRSKRLQAEPAQLPVAAERASKFGSKHTYSIRHVGECAPIEVGSWCSTGDQVDEAPGDTRLRKRETLGASSEKVLPQSGTGHNYA